MRPFRLASMASMASLASLASLAATTLAIAVAAPPAMAQTPSAGPPAVAEPRGIAKNWRARIVFKSGVTQDLLWVGVSTDAFVQLRAAFWRHLNNEGPNRYTATGPDGLQIAISWTDVSAVTTWSD